MRHLLRFVPVDQIGVQRHVMADGAARPGTVAVLSHWPGTKIADNWRRDLSAEIALAAAALPNWPPLGVDLATLDHYDEDGVITLAQLCIDGLAADHGRLLVEAARVGDFGVVRDETAAKISFAIDAIGDPQRTPVERLQAGSSDGAAVEGEGSGTRKPRVGAEPERVVDCFVACGIAAQYALTVLPALAANPEDFGDLWSDQYAAYRASCEALADGALRIEETPDLDLAVVFVDLDVIDPKAAWDGAVFHSAAIYSATQCRRVATIVGGTYELRYRYESWVRLRIRPAPPRLMRADLTPAVRELNALEESGAEWVFDGASALTPALHTWDDAESSIPAGQFLEVVRRHLRAAASRPPAWDPYS